MRKIFAMLCLMLVTACATVPDSSCVTLAPQVQYCLQSPEAVGDFSALQQVDLTWSQGKETALAELEVEGASFTMAVLTPMGQKLMQFKYVPPELEPMGSISPKVDPRWMAALVQLAIWPAKDVSNGLRGDYEWSALQTHRSLRSSGQLLLDIAIQGQLPKPERLHMQLPQQQIALDIRNIRNEAPP